MFELKLNGLSAPKGPYPYNTVGTRLSQAASPTIEFRLYCSPCPNDSYLFENLDKASSEVNGLSPPKRSYPYNAVDTRLSQAASPTVESRLYCSPCPNDSYLFENLDKTSSEVNRVSNPITLNPNNPNIRVLTPGNTTTADLALKHLFPELTNTST